MKTEGSAVKGAAAQPWGLVLRGWDAGAARVDNVALGASRDSTQARRVLGMYLRGR